MNCLLRPVSLPLALSICLLASMSVSPLKSAVPAPAIMEESKVVPYTLPDPLIAGDGTRIQTPAQWRAKRRPELLELFSKEVYGRTPTRKLKGVHYEVTSKDTSALGGRATRKEVTIWFTKGNQGPRMRLLMYVPNHVKQPPPVFLGLNFGGNHAVDSDPGIAKSELLVVFPPGEPLPTSPRGTDRPLVERGGQADRWQVAKVIDRGYATATAWYQDLCPDRVGGLDENVAPLFAKGGTEGRADDGWGAIGVWAWGLSRALDYLETDSSVDARRVAVHGHSRLGKTALWAGAQDERFAMVISNDSGCGGAALSKRVYGETVGLINKAFPHWFAKRFRFYDDNEAALPVDQHELLALIAPRPLYVASASEDQWADPKGEFLSAQAAGPVYALFGKSGVGVKEMPPVDKPVGGTVAYHVRTGKHDITAYDWEQYLNFADKHLRARPKSGNP